MKKFILSLLLVSFSLSSFAYKASQTCINHIKQHETCQLKAYWDSNGYSIGWGHHASDVKQGMKISQAKADAYLKSDLKTAEEGARRLINSLPYKYNFSQAFFDGLVDLVYNCGEGGVKSSTFYQRLKKCRVKNNVMNKSDYDYTLSAVKTVRISCKGHIKRRQATYKMMLS